ncbi:MAG: hypothetical protein HZB92_03300 [Euryarchaeota archaeon]|nr:hypothetical protein [Euryarchaeota archaeon]
MSSDGSAGDRRRVSHVPTGVDKLDASITGYPRGRTTLIMGGAGSGKTILTLHFIAAACARGERCVQLLTEEEKDDIYSQARSFGWEMEKYEKDGTLTVVEILPERVGGMRLPEKFQDFLQFIKVPKGANLVVDNMSVFGMAAEAIRYRERMDSLVFKLKQQGCTTLLVFDDDLEAAMRSALMHSTFSVVRLFKRDNPFTDRRERAMEVIKMRNTRIPSSHIFYEITDAGIFIEGEGKANFTTVKS